jgi:hypothetical protein
MDIDPNIVDMVAKLVAVNAVAVLVLAVMSYALSALMLDGLEALDRRLDPSRALAKGSPRLKNPPHQPPLPTDSTGSRQATSRQARGK